MPSRLVRHLHLILSGNFFRFVFFFAVVPSFFLHISYETDPARPASGNVQSLHRFLWIMSAGTSSEKRKEDGAVCASGYINIMDFEDYLNGYENALKMPHEAFHAYCMNMRKAAPMDERISLQINYRCLLLAAELHEKKEKRKRNEK